MALFAATAGAGCASDSGDAGGGSACPLASQSCPSGCFPIMGRALSGTCVESVLTVLGCSDTRGGTLDIGCIQSTADGSFYRLPHGTTEEQKLSQDPAWTLCTPEEKSTVTSADFC